MKGRLSGTAVPDAADPSYATFYGHSCVVRGLPEVVHGTVEVVHEASGDDNQSQKSKSKMTSFFAGCVLQVHERRRDKFPGNDKKKKVGNHCSRLVILNGGHGGYAGEPLL